MITLPVFAYFLVQWPSVQTFLTRQIAKQVSANLNAKFEVGRVDIVFFNRVLLRDIHIEDQQGDTLLKADRLLATIHYLNRSKKKIHFNQINMHNARINLQSDADSVLNLQFIIDALSSDDTLKNRWDYRINSINLKNSRFVYQKHNKVKNEYGINFDDIMVASLNVLANNIHRRSDSLFFKIRYLNLSEKNGFILNHFSSENIVSPSGIELEDVHIITPFSRLNLEHFHMNYEDAGAFGDFVNQVELAGNFNTSAIDFRDLAYFAPGLRGIDLEVNLSGEITGKINHLRGSGLNIKSLDETSLLADVSMIGLPEFRETFILLNLHEFISSSPEVLELVRSIRRNDQIATSLPVDLPVLGKLQYTGEFTGFLNDFVAFGELNTDRGTIRSDISLNPDADNMLNFRGRLRTIDFDAGALTGSGQIGKISFNGGLDGQISPQKGIYASMEGVIDSVFLFGYNYKQIQLAGKLEERKFDGFANIHDPNLHLDFLGSIDLSRETPSFDFLADVSGARLHDLKLIQQDTSLVLSFVSRANFSGSHIDNLNGKIDVGKTVFERNDHVFSIENVILEAEGAEDDNRRVTLYSDLAEAKIEGNYEFATIIRSFNHFIGNYIPSYSNQQRTRPDVTGNSFSFNLRLDDVSEFTGFFIPRFSLSEGTRLEGLYDPSSHVAVITGYTGEFRINNHFFRDMQLVSQSDDSVFSIMSNARHVLVGNRFVLENMDVTSTIVNDSITFSTRWDNHDKIRYKGEISASVGFLKDPGVKKPAVNIDINPSRIIIADTIWHIEYSNILVDSTSLQINDFVFGRPDQHMRVHGKLSENPHDSLHIQFLNIDVRNIEHFTSLDNFHITGNITGNVGLSNVFKDPVFITDLEVDRFLVNHQDFGNLKISSDWDHPGRNVFMNIYSTRGDEKILNIEGAWQTENRLLDLNIFFDNINLQSVDGYLDIFADLRGMAGGNLRLNGTLDQPLFNGNIQLQQASFTMDYLKTDYNFTHDIAVENNNINFRDLTVYDSRNNHCRVNGNVTNRNFSDFHLNLYMYPEAFMALNTTERDNNLYYGRVFASGIVHIAGPVDNLTMNISARTDRNTRFFIPLQRSGEISDLHFLTFSNNSGPSLNENPGAQEPRNYELDLAGIQLNFDMEITPDAEVQIIFDSKIGDIIRGRGSGSVKMEINTSGQFNMLGEYIIEQGDYLFTLQNVINKRFDIERGSRLIWTGDPFDADVDLKATYRLRASPRALMAAYSNRVDERYARRVPVECHILMKEKLMTPAINFDIDFPTADPDTRHELQSILNTEEKRNRQFLALLVMNNFLPEQDMHVDGRYTLGMSATEAGKTTVSEFFSNQLSNWVSQISRDVDFGVNWRPGDEITPDEVELALSTQVFNDRISINGHVDVGGRRTSTSNIVGDVDVDIKLTPSGKLRLKGFTRANDNLIRPYLSPYTQGVGLFYREDFDSFDELLSRYWNRIFQSEKE